LDVLNRKIKIERIEPGKNIQFSYNSWGHLAIRTFDEEKDKDFLIVLTSEETLRLAHFLKKIFNSD